MGSCDRRDFNALDRDDDDTNDNLAVLRMLGLESSVPELEAFARLVEEYTKLNLTNVTDRLDAFSGMLTSLRPVIGPTIAGMPIISSPRCMAWEIMGGGSSRRIGLFPSWSWAGWEGQVSYIGWSGSDERLRIGTTSGSKTARDDPQVLWETGMDNSPIETSPDVDYACIKVLHFQAETIEQDGRQYILLLENEGEETHRAMEIKWSGECAERVGGDLKEFGKGEWAEAKPCEKLIHLS